MNIDVNKVKRVFGHKKGVSHFYTYWHKDKVFPFPDYYATLLPSSTNTSPHVSTNSVIHAWVRLAEEGIHSLQDTWNRLENSKFLFSFHLYGKACTTAHTKSTHTLHYTITTVLFSQSAWHAVKWPFHYYHSPFTTLSIYILVEIYTYIFLTTLEADDDDEFSWWLLLGKS